MADMFIFCLTILARFVTIAAAALGFLWYLIKHDKRGKWAVAVIITAAVVFTSAHGQWWYHSGGGMNNILVWDNHEYVGVLQTAIDDNDHLCAVGRLALGETEEDLDYLDLQFEDGKLVGTKEALQYAEPIKEALGRSAKGFSGSSVSYEALREVHKQITEPVRGDYNWQGFLKELLFCSVVPIIAWSMVLKDFFKKRKQKQLRKTQIMDL